MSKISEEDKIFLVEKMAELKDEMIDLKRGYDETKKIKERIEKREQDNQRDIALIDKLDRELTGQNERIENIRAELIRFAKERKLDLTGLI